MYKKVSTDMNFAARETETLAFWNGAKIFEKTRELRRGGEPFTFYDGPPTANGKPHIGHVLTRAMKDLIPRYQTMKGRDVLRKAGWDTHGLPVELEVEKLLGISGKPQIETYGVEPFIKACKESVWKYKGEWEALSERVAFWADMDDPYITYEDNYIESVWWALKTIWDKGLIYRGHRVVPYCPRCGTALSSHEVAQGYKDVRETSVYARFKVVGAADEYLLAWTTTPWTLPSNIALCVNAGEEYVKAKCGSGTYILAGALAETVLTEGYEVTARVKGAELEGLAYEPLFGFSETDEAAAHKVVCDDYVTLTDGTGIVHIAPAFGEDDARVGKVYGLPFVQRVDAQGRMTAECGELAGLFVKDADPVVIKDLKARGLLYKTAAYEHSYPFCWRCDTPLIYYARDAWFIRMSEMRERLLANNETVNWLPDNMKRGRFGNWLENVADWSLSRERYWGTPLPIWTCGCGHVHCVGSKAELGADVELHKPYIDNVRLKCPKCGGEMRRVSEVIDCWFDSGSMPFAQWHYPFENRETFERNFPAQFISEAVDQTRGWFYTLMAISTLLFDKAPYENVLVLGLVADKDGVKMSKHLGNGIAPNAAIDALGADAVRWYFFTGSQPWLPSRFSLEAVGEAARRFMGTLWNTYAFYVLYANIDGYNPGDYPASESGHIMDKWLISGLNTLIGRVDAGLAEYKITESARAIAAFTDDLSNWYVRRCRERYWASGMERDKLDAYGTLYTAIMTLVKLAAPFTPFIAEEIYQNLKLPNDPESVHLCGFPVCDGSLIDAELEGRMDYARAAVALGRAARETAGIKIRQPLAEMFIQAEREDAAAFRIIAEELNVKKVTFVTDASRFSSYKFKPQLKTLGPKYGKLIGKISAYLAGADGNALMAALKAGAVEVEIDGNAVTLSMDDVLCEAAQVEGFASASDRGVTVALDTRLTDGLIEEGFVREIISKVQTMRKEAGFEVMDRIRLTYETTEKLAAVIGRNGAEIAKETLADAVACGIGGGYRKEWHLNGEAAALAVERV